MRGIATVSTTTEGAESSGVHARPPMRVATTQAAISRRRFLRAGVAAGLAAAAACTGADAPTTGPSAGVRPNGTPTAGGRSASRIAVIGAGLAGLTAAYELRKLGHVATVYEARMRVGGRVHSVSAGPDLLLDRGGSFVNTDHADTRLLVSELGLELHALGADPTTATAPETAFHFDGRRVPEVEMADALRDLAAQIADDADRLDDDYETWAARFDPLSVADYLDQHADLIGAPFARALLEAGVRSEYGAEPAESSALQLLFMRPTVEGDRVEVVATSDEAFVVAGGSGRVPAALARALDDRVQLGRRLVRCERRGRTHQLTFSDGATIEADWTIVTVPPAQLRTVEWNTDLPRAFRRYMTDVDLGRNEKTFVGFDPKVWQDPRGFADDQWTDEGHDVAWDATARQIDRRDGALTFFFGGDRVDARPDADTLAAWLDTVVPGADAAATGFSLRTDWTGDRFARGAYANFRPGQLTSFGRYFWIPGESRVAFDTLVFAGEQFSDEWYGFMNGAVETGRLAAYHVAEGIG